MDKLIQTKECSIVYGSFRGEDNQELFRCPRKLDNTDLRNYINKTRSLVCPFESVHPFVDDETEDLRNVEGKTLIGYWRMYFRNGFWDGRWMFEGNDRPSETDCAGLNFILDWIFKNFNKGCDYSMKAFCENNFQKWGGDNRYLVRPFMSEYYKIMLDTTYGNGDYPVRIYTYKEGKK